MVKSIFEDRAGMIVQPVKYGFFDTFRFLMPFATRHKPVERFIREYRDIKLKYPDAQVSVLAHSFGTYVVTKALRQETDIVLDRVILCGCIVEESFRVAPLRAQLGDQPVVNDCGTNDIWPLLAKSITWGYGATGTFGFGTSGIVDRFHPFAHSSYFDADFVRKFWVPFMRSGTIVQSEWGAKRTAPPAWQSLLAASNLKYLIPLLLIGYTAWSAIYANTQPLVSFDRKINIGHWVGIPRLILPLHFDNSTFTQKAFYVEKVTLTSPQGKTAPLIVRFVYACGAGMTPASQVIPVDAMSSTVCSYLLLGDSRHMMQFNDELNAIAQQRQLNTMLPDYSRTLITGKLLEDLSAVAESSKPWSEGTWSISLRYQAISGGSPGSNTTLTGRFDVTAEDLQQFDRAIGGYKSGIGVFEWWLDFGDSMLLTKDLT
jgi:pimeloyl-ACP methyl ester carboxylesterase